MKEALGRDHDDTLAAFDNLGVTLGSWQRYEESEKIHGEVLLARDKRLGATNLGTLTTMNNLAMTLLNQSRPDEAKAIMKTVFEQRKYNSAMNIHGRYGRYTILPRSILN